jgi:RNA polymerase sigma-70 factor (ECF subfamily)
VVEKFPAFEHAGRPGAFRAWLRGISANRLRMYWRSRGRPNAFDPEPILQQLEDPHSELSRQWDREHDAHVTQRLLQLLEPEFKPATWQAFQRLLDGASAEAVAADLGLTVNAVCIAKSRVLRRLREELAGLVL